MTSTLQASACRIAAVWLPAKMSLRRSATHGSALSGSIQSQGSEPPDRSNSRSASCVLADNLLLGPGGDNPLGAHRSNAVDLPEAIGLGLDQPKSASRHRPDCNTLMA
jgi:hypothetical protein